MNCKFTRDTRPDAVRGWLLCDCCWLMLREFFCSPSLNRRLLSYFGSVILVLMAMMLALLDGFVNTWYGAFYNLGGASAEMLTNINNTGSSNTTTIHEARDAGLAEVTKLMTTFCIVVFPAQVLQPLMEFVNQHFSFTWRLCMMESYISRWEALDSRMRDVEGASQRIHEDTQRFALSLQRGASASLQALLKLAVFIPRLNALSAQMPLPSYLVGKPFIAEGWILHTAVASAVIGYSVALHVARHLVDLDINNQRVEARLRKRLVIAEGQDADAGLGRSTHCCDERAADGRAADGRAVDGDRACDDGSVKSAGGEAQAAREAIGYQPLWEALLANYSALYRNFLSFNIWVSFWMQVPFILPMILGAPMLFSLEHPIQMGLLIQISDAFQKTTSAFSAGVDRWADVNEFRSVVRRLREFEACLDAAEEGAGGSCGTAGGGAAQNAAGAAVTLL